MTLYDIDRAIMDCFDPDTGELTDPEGLAALQMDRETKLESVALWIKDLTAQAEAIKHERQVLADRQKAAEDKAESLRKWLGKALGGERLTTPRAAVTFRKTASVIVPDVWALDAKWVKYSDPTPDKNAIKAAIKAGQEVKGAFLVDGTSMTVK